MRRENRHCRGGLAKLKHVITMQESDSNQSVDPSEVKRRKKAEYMKAWWLNHPEYSKAWREKHKERLLEKQRLRSKDPKVLDSKHKAHKKWRANNLVDERARWREYYKANRASLMAKKAIYSALNESELIEKRKKYYHNVLKHDPEWRIKNRIRAKLGKIKRRNVPCGDQKLVSKVISKIRKSKFVSCHWCGTKVSGKKAHIDHVIPLAKTGIHSAENLCASCAPCNSSKSAKLPSEFAPMGQTHLCL